MDRPSHDFPLYPSNLSVMLAGYRFPYTPILPSSSPIYSTSLAELRAGPRSNRRPWLRNGSPEFVTAQADDDMFVSSPSVSGGPSVPAPSPPGPFVSATSRPSPSAPQPASFGPFASDPSVAGPSAPEQTSFGPFVFSPSDFSDENIPPPAAMPFAGGVVRRGTPEPEEPAAARLQSAADFAAFAARPAVDFEAPMMSPVRRGLRRSRLRGDESMADWDGDGDDDDDLDPEECPTERPGRPVKRSGDGYDSDAWRHHNRLLDRLRRLVKQKQHRKATSSTSGRNASKKRKETESGESPETSGSEEKRPRQMPLADGDSSGAGGR